MVSFQHRRGLKRRTIVTIIVLCVLLWILGFFRFLAVIPMTVDKPSAQADAIVVFTGGTLRLEKGLDLLEAGQAPKLFVSGVHSGVEVQELLTLSRQRPSTLDCCITLGYEADDTQGNAIETADWLVKTGYKKIRLVTAAYHMPRSIRELRAIAPEIIILRHPVFPAHVKIADWYNWPGSTALIIGEYNKFLFIYLREWLFKII